DGGIDPPHDSLARGASLDRGPRRGRGTAAPSSPAPERAARLLHHAHARLHAVHEGLRTTVLEPGYRVRLAAGRACQSERGAGATLERRIRPCGSGFTAPRERGDR